MKALIVAWLVVAAPLAGCGNKTTQVQTVQVSHDALAEAQDLEARLCWGVASAKQAPPTSMAHCTSPTAATIKLTDAIHQSFNAKLAQALTIHRDLTAQAKAGGTPDVTQLAALITQIVADLTKLQQTPDVQTLTATVQKGATIK